MTCSACGRDDHSCACPTASQLLGFLADLRPAESQAGVVAHKIDYDGRPDEPRTVPSTLELGTLTAADSGLPKPIDGPPPPDSGMPLPPTGPGREAGPAALVRYTGVDPAWPAPPPNQVAARPEPPDWCVPISPRRRWVPAAATALALALIAGVLIVAHSDSHHPAARSPQPVTAPSFPSADGGSGAVQSPTLLPAWVPVQAEHPAPARMRLPAALYLGATTPGAVITPQQAQVVLNAIWTLRQDAFSSHSRSLMAAFETGPALESDEVTCGCTTRSPRGPILQESVLVPPAASYPATFLAEAVTTLNGSRYFQYLIISRQSGRAPWMVVSDPGEDGADPLDQPAAGPAGLDAPIAQPGPDENLPSELAAYWQYWNDYGHAPLGSNLAPGEWTSSVGQSSASTPQGAVNSGNGLIGYYQYQAGPSDQVWNFNTTQGPLTCGVVRIQSYWTSPNGVYQPPSRTNWGPTVPPGAYPALASTDIAQPCFLQRPGQEIEVFSGDSIADTEQAVLNPSPA